MFDARLQHNSTSPCTPELSISIFCKLNKIVLAIRKYMVLSAESPEFEDYEYLWNGSVLRKPQS